MKTSTEPAASGSQPRGSRAAVEGFAQVCTSLGDDLGWALGVLLRSYRKAAIDVFADLPGGPRGYQVLRASAQEGPATQLALAQQLGIDRTVMTYLLDDLQAAGLVERRPDPADRRARRIVVTESGRARLGALTEGLRHAEERMLAPLDRDDVAAFRALLQRLATHADRLDPAAPCTVAQEVADVDDAPVTRPGSARPA